MTKYALITGASRGLGKAIALRLATDGFAVIINYQSNKEAAEDTLKQVQEAGGTGELLPFDVSNPHAIDTALEAWQNAHPDDYISVLVNNAGIRQDNLMIFMQEEQWNRVLDTTLNGFFYITRRLLKDMMTHRKGRIINMASLSGLKGLPGQTNYSAAKAALIGATKALAQEVAARKVTVNAIAPGFIASDMTKDLDEAELKKLIPLGRFGGRRSGRELAGLHAVVESQRAEVEERRQDAVDAVVEEIVELSFCSHGEAHEGDFHLVFFQRDIVAVEVAAMIDIFRLRVDNRVVTGRVEFILKDLAGVHQSIVDGPEDLRRATERVVGLHLVFKDFYVGVAVVIQLVSAFLQALRAFR